MAAATAAAAAAAAATAVRHLVVLCHGLHGSASQLKVLCAQLQERLGNEAFVYATTKNEERFLTTHDGIDTGGTRVADEVVEMAARFPQLDQFSIIGHSLGGLYSRYCVGLLYERGFFDRVQPVNYISLSSPHMGSRRCYFGARMSSVFQWAAPKVLARTGQQLMLEDDESLPLLLQMAQPEGKWYQALKRFQRVVLYSVIEGDTKVQYCSAAVLPRNPYTSKQRIPVVMEKYPHIVDPVASMKVAEYADKVGSESTDTETAEREADVHLSPAASDAAVAEMAKSPTVSQLEAMAEGDVLADQLSGASETQAAACASSDDVAATAESTTAAPPLSVTTVTETTLTQTTVADSTVTQTTVTQTTVESGAGSVTSPRQLLQSLTTLLPAGFGEMAKQKLVAGVTDVKSYVSVALKRLSSRNSIEATGSESTPVSTPTSPFAKDAKRDVLLTMMNHLQTLPLERVDVCFDGRLKMLTAHEDVVMRWERSKNGMDIVQHLVDGFAHRKTAEAS